ncbi:MAG: hypothetical protein GKS01_16540 [Alphaproteobacteria bacterium]|nr:hypothetical protein [Alphaproteobacteria bacterium]
MRTRNSGRFRKNSLAAAAATTAMGAASASAAIIHVDPADITLGPGVASHFIEFTALPAADGLTITGGISKGTQNRITDGLFGPTGGGGTTPTYIEYGDTFGAGDVINNGSFTSHANIGETVFLGFAFTPDGSDFFPVGTGNHFGWVRVTQTAADSIVLHEWAYQDQADVAIFAGEGGTFTPGAAVSEPAALMLFAIGAVFAARMHARRTRQ